MNRLSDELIAKMEKVLADTSLIDENIPYLIKVVDEIQKKANRMCADVKKRGVTPEFEKEVANIRRIRYYLAELISKSEENARALEQCADEMISCYALPLSAGPGVKKILINSKTTPGIKNRMDRYATDVYVGTNEVFLRALAAAASLSPDKRPVLTDKAAKTIGIRFSIPDERYSLLTLYCKRMNLDLTEGINSILDGFLPTSRICFTV